MVSSHPHPPPRASLEVSLSALFLSWLYAFHRFVLFFCARALAGSYAWRRFFNADESQ